MSADIEADGPIPGEYSILSFGLAVAARFDGDNFEALEPAAATFYRELKPISDAHHENANARAKKAKRMTREQSLQSAGRGGLRWPRCRPRRRWGRDALFLDDASSHAAPLVVRGTRRASRHRSEQGSRATSRSGGRLSGVSKVLCSGAE
jgi:hypothetical protein